MDEEPGSGDVSDNEIQAQLSRLDCYFGPLRWRPSPLAALETIIFSGFGHTSNKEMYLRYLQECFGGLDEILNLYVKETDMWMIAHLLRPFEDESGGIHSHRIAPYRLEVWIINTYLFVWGSVGIFDIDPICVTRTSVVKTDNAFYSQPKPRE